LVRSGSTDFGAPGREGLVDAGGLEVRTGWIRARGPPDFRCILFNKPRKEFPEGRHPEFKDYDFDSPLSIRGVKGSRADKNIHQEITSQWEDFRANNPKSTRKQIESFAAQVDEAFRKHWFK